MLILSGGPIPGHAFGELPPGSTQFHLLHHIVQHGQFGVRKVLQLLRDIAAQYFRAREHTDGELGGRIHAATMRHAVHSSR